MKTIAQTSTRDLLAQKTGFPAKEYDLYFESTLHKGSDKFHFSIYYGYYEAAYILVTRLNKNDIDAFQCVTFGDAADKVAQLMVTAKY